MAEWNVSRTLLYRYDFTNPAMTVDNLMVVFDLYNNLRHTFVNILLHTSFMKHIIEKLYDGKIPIVLVFPRY